jgi:predicted transcriptional regulator
MDELWAAGEGTVHQVRDALNARAPKERAYTTVMTVMARLHTKGLLQRERRGRSDVYVPRLDREQYLDARARSQVSALVEEFGDFALAHFAAQMAGLDAKRRKKLQRIARRG